MRDGIDDARECCEMRGKESDEDEGDIEEDKDCFSVGSRPIVGD